MQDCNDLSAAKRLGMQVYDVVKIRSLCMFMGEQEGEWVCRAFIVAVNCTAKIGVSNKFAEFYELISSCMTFAGFMIIFPVSWCTTFAFQHLFHLFRALKI